MRVVVQKFGGKCVEPGGNELIAAERIMETRDLGGHPVVVVSAMGRELRDWNAEIEELVRKPEGARKLALEHFYSTAELVRLVLEIDPAIEPRELDMLMSCGEIISTVRLAHLLKAKGYATVALSGGQVGLITDGFFGHARVISTEIRQLVECLDRMAIPLVAGFQGIAPSDHAITTLGEGGSDYTAICLAYALQHAQRTPLQEAFELAPVEIYKDVDGVMTANPAIFPAERLANGTGPRRLRTLSYDELCTMSQYGADVIQAESARMARRYALAVQVRNYRKPDDPGTLISTQQREEVDDVVTGVADMPNMTVFSVADGGERTHRRVAELLAQARCNFQSIPLGDGSWKFAVKREKYRNVTAAVQQLIGGKGMSPIFDNGHWALVTLVGDGMRGQVETIAQHARDVLHGAGIPTEGEILDTLSYGTLLPEEYRQDAVIALHDAMTITTKRTSPAG